MVGLIVEVKKRDGALPANSQKMSTEPPEKEPEFCLLLQANHRLTIRFLIFL
jgi:hypothetical protein